VGSNWREEWPEDANPSLDNKVRKENHSTISMVWEADYVTLLDEKVFCLLFDRMTLGESWHSFP
jgi:hypothetical protein